MDGLRDANLMTVVFKLMDRGLSGDGIDRVMRLMVGTDWREVHVSVWYKRLQNKGFPVHNNEDSFVDDLEALVKGHEYD